MSSLTVQEAQAKLTELIHNLRPGDEVVITDNNEPVARLIAAERRQPPPRRPGTLRGTVKYMAPDFDALDESIDAYGITRLW
jgi:prevent-host-death family protein